MKYGNALPDIPFDPKFITYPFEANRFVQYNATSLERNYKHELLAEHDLGVTIDLINPDTYKIDPMGKVLDTNFNFRNSLCTWVVLLMYSLKT